MKAARALLLLLAGAGVPVAVAADRPAVPASHPPLAPAPAAAQLPAATVMARAGAQTITAGDVDAALGAMPAPDRLEYATPAMLREFVEFLVDRRLMAALARRDGLAADPAVARQLAALPTGASAEELLASAWMEAQLARLPAPSAAEIAAYYAAHPEEFAAPGRARPLAAASAGIAARLQDAARQEAAAGLREQARQGVDVVVVEAALSAYLAASGGAP